MWHALFCVVFGVLIFEGGWLGICCFLQCGGWFPIHCVVGLVEGKVEHPLNVVSVCCKFVFNLVVR